MGFAELVAVLFIVLLFFGGSRLPALGAGLGKGLRSLRRAASGDATSRSGPTSAQRQLPPGGGGATGDDGR